MVLEEDFQSFSQVMSWWELCVSPYLMNIYMKFHHIWLTDIIVGNPNRKKVLIFGFVGIFEYIC